MTAAELVAAHGARLLAEAGRVIRAGIGVRRLVDVQAAPADLAAPGASFVTLKRGADLRGCIGRIEPTRPLLVDVAENAYAAAFEDPRFPPVRPHELDDLTVSIAVLAPPTPWVVADEAALLAGLRPGHDGLILAAGGRRALFLPSVWEVLPDPADFVRALKQKAGWAPRAWPADVEVARFETVATPTVSLASA